MTSITTDFIQANGLCFEVLTCGSGNRLALCLHGFPECNYSWRYQMPLLAELGYQVWAPNLRGYGRSSRPKSVRDYGINHLLKDITAIIEASKCYSVLLIGHDWGAALSWLLAMDTTLPFEGLIIMNVPTHAVHQVFKNLEAAEKVLVYILFSDSLAPRVAL